MIALSLAKLANICFYYCSDPASHRRISQLGASELVQQSHRGITHKSERAAQTQNTQCGVSQMHACMHTLHAHTHPQV